MEDVVRPTGNEDANPRPTSETMPELIDRVWRRLTADLVAVICSEHLQCHTAKELLDCLERGHVHAMRVLGSPELSAKDDRQIVDLAVAAFVTKLQEEFWALEIKAGGGY